MYRFFEKYVLDKYAGKMVLAILFFLLTLWIVRVWLSNEQNHQGETHLQFVLGSSSVWSQVDASFFVSNVFYIDQNGTHQSLTFEDSPISQAHIALLRLGNEQGSQVLKLTFPSGIKSVTALGFTLGLPHSVNHGNPLTAEKPLNAASMFWTWQQGYKFLRMDLISEEKRAALHLGATGCESPAPVRPPEGPCAQPNRVAIVLPIEKPAEPGQTWRIELMLDYLNQQYANLEDFQMCSGMYEQDPFCADWLHSLGLNPETGQCQGNCESQQLFRLVH